MKITQEVREFARLQEQNPPRDGEGDQAQLGGGDPEQSPNLEVGMAEMSKRFHDEGGELYVPAE